MFKKIFSILIVLFFSQQLLMAETINVIKSAESGKPPTDSVIKKFEMILGIELMVESSNDHQSMIGQGSSSRGMTIGDYLKDLR